MTSRRRRPMTGVEVLEQIFHDKDSDDSYIELGDDESDADDEQPVADVQDAVDADVLIFSACACRPTLSHGIVLWYKSGHTVTQTYSSFSAFCNCGSICDSVSTV